MSRLHQAFRLMPLALRVQRLFTQETGHVARHEVANVIAIFGCSPKIELCWVRPGRAPRISFASRQPVECLGCEQYKRERWDAVEGFEVP